MVSSTKTPASAKRRKAALLHHHSARVVGRSYSPLHRVSKVSRDSTSPSLSCGTGSSTGTNALTTFSSTIKHQQQQQQPRVEFTSALTTSTNNLNDNEETGNEVNQDQANFFPDSHGAASASACATTIKKPRAPKLSWGTHTTAASTSTGTGSTTSTTHTTPHTHCGLDAAGYYLLETSTDTIETYNAVDSTSTTAGTNTNTPFRFTSFPASLPRIHNNDMPQRRSSSDLNDGHHPYHHHHQPTAAAPPTALTTTNLTCPASVRKRMAFGVDPLADRSHDTSLSSSSLLLDDADYHLEEEEEEIEPSSSHLAQQQQHPQHQHPQQQQQHSMLLGTPVPRARLNFSSVWSSPCCFLHELEPKRVSSFASSVSPVNPQHHHHITGGGEDSLMSIPHSSTTALAASAPAIAAASSSSSSCGMTPMRIMRLPSSGSGTSGPQTPREVKLHFQLADAAQCSPIPGIPEEDGDLSSKSGAVGTGTNNLRGGAFSFPTASSSFARNNNEASSSSSSRLSTSRDDSISSMATAATNNTTTTTVEGGGGARQRRMTRRPMPDMTAFDSDAMAARGGGGTRGNCSSSAGTSSRSPSRSRGDRSSSSLDDYSNNVQQQQLYAPHPSSPRLLCPPTPVRTPAWATHHCGGEEEEIGIGGGGGRTIERGGRGLVPSLGCIGAPPGGGGGGRLVAKRFYERSNSLIATKVLATCSPQVLDGRASLESNYGNNQKNNNNQSREASSSCHPMINMGASDTTTTVQDPAASRSCTEKNNWLHDGRGAGETIGIVQKSNKRDSVGQAGTPPVVVSMATHFDILSTLGRGTFADVYRVRSKVDSRMYAIKRNRRQFRGTRDREKALAEVKCMQRLQQSVCTRPERGDKSNNNNLSFSLYILFFFQAWQEDGYFFCQTELCCRDTCRELLESLRSHWNLARTRYPSLNKLPIPSNYDTSFHPHSDGRLFPEASIWKICHDVSAGLSHIHSHGFVHFDIKPSNLFFVPHVRFGAMCKIGDFGMAGEIGSSEDGQEGDQKYMAPELLASDRKHPSADIFSLGLTLYELASNLSFHLPCEGTRWHELRCGQPNTASDIPACRNRDLVTMILAMLRPSRDDRPTADSILGIRHVAIAGDSCDEFLRDYLLDIEEFDRREEQQMDMAFQEDQTPRHAHAGRVVICSPTTNLTLLPKPPLLYSPETAAKS